MSLEELYFLCPLMHALCFLVYWVSGISLLSSSSYSIWWQDGKLTESSLLTYFCLPPVKGSNIFLKDFPLSGSALALLRKSQLEISFRYGQRMFKHHLGVAVPVALLFAGLGLQSSIGGIPTSVEETAIRLLPSILGESSRTR